MKKKIKTNIIHPATSVVEADFTSGVDSKLSRKKIGNPLIRIKNGLLIILLISALGSAAYFWNDARDAREHTTQAIEAKQEEETKNVVESLSSVLLIDTSDEPTVARIENPDVLKTSNQDFYKDVQVGDYLVLYSKKAIIFRLNERKIINVAPIVDTSQTAQ